MTTQSSAYLDAVIAHSRKPLLILEDGEDAVRIDGEELHDRVRRLASALQQCTAPGDRVLLRLAPGLDYVCALLACLEANVVAVPLPLADDSPPASALASGIEVIERDSRPSLVLTGNATAADGPSSSVRRLDITEALSSGRAAHARAARPDDVALLLYTSGSTALPKGIALSRGNLVAQSIEGAAQWRLRARSHVVSWIPTFHNFGLHFGVLSPFLVGAATTLLSSRAVVARPRVWFEAIARYGASHTAAPNFALELCCDVLDARSCAGLSLRSLELLANGGELLRWHTYKRFVSRFAPLGLDRAAYCAHYGLSETGSVSTSAPGEPRLFVSLDLQGLRDGVAAPATATRGVRRVARCGRPGAPVSIVVVNPITRRACPPSEIGEVWVKGPGVALGYWGDRVYAGAGFSNTVRDTGERGFFRTGDLGYLENGCLSIVGREKDVMVVRGKNHHPIDIEVTVRDHVPCASRSIVAFTCGDDAERVVVVIETTDAVSEADGERVAGAVRAAVSEGHGLHVDEVVFAEEGAVSRTVGGKVRRGHCRRAFVDGRMPVRRCVGAAPVRGVAAPSPPRAGACADVEERLLAIVRAELPAAPPNLEQSTRIRNLGLDSVRDIRLAQRVEETFGVPFPPVLLFKYRTLGDICRHIEERLALPEESARRGAAPAEAVRR